jgi:putative toxin-antitoxin system antitoxin component (TIGR02293 family)
MKRASTKTASDMPVGLDEQTARVMAHALDIFGSRTKVRGWLNTPNLALGGINPQALLGTPGGIEQVETILGRIDHGVYS